MERKRVAIAVLLALSISAYARLSEDQPLTSLQFILVFTIGALTALLVRELTSFRKAR